jgi:hypothetical protein
VAQVVAEELDQEPTVQLHGVGLLILTEQVLADLMELRQVSAPAPTAMPTVVAAAVVVAVTTVEKVA